MQRDATDYVNVYISVHLGPPPEVLRSISPQGATPFPQSPVAPATATGATRKIGSHQLVSLQVAAGNRDAQLGGNQQS